MPTLAAAKAANAAVNLPYSVALFVGATSGIGQATAKVFADSVKGNAHIIICARNEEAANSLIASFPKNPNAKYEFLQCDVSRMANVTQACKTLKEERGLTKLNYLFMSPGFLGSMFGKFTDNGEGVDRKFAVHFYSRFKFFNELAPLMQRAKDEGEEARVISVYGSAQGGKADLSDLGLFKTYSVPKLGLQGPTYSDLIVEELAVKNPTLSFIHAYPGVVKTSISTSGPLPLRMLGKVLGPFMTDPADCGEWMARTIFDPAMARGAFHVDNHGDLYPPNKVPLSAEGQKAVYDHFMEIASKY
ncbi:NAD(P)-binding protein [Clavulina sp. PMI_390]|nr:NAD(P)-binding protein [Clavulina sp. PMI_390]